MKILLIKIGSQVITQSDGFLNLGIIQKLVEQVVALEQQGYRVVLVSSGAVAAGRGVVPTISRRVTHPIASRQLLAAVGQVKLMEAYQKYLALHGKVCAQVLVTKEDFRDRHHYLAMRDCLGHMFEEGVVPVVNENDVVAIDELMFTDNDELAGLLASMLKAEKLVILTGVEGVYDRPLESEGAQVIPEVVKGSKVLAHIHQASSKSCLGRGGIFTKCQVGKKLAALGIETHILSGKDPSILKDVLRGFKEAGTRFIPHQVSSNVKKWLAYSAGFHKGTVYINSCAFEVFQEKREAKSLLPVGITAVVGDFKKGDLLEIRGPQHVPVGYGIAEYGSQKALEYMGKKFQKCLVHYDTMYLHPKD